MYQTPAAAANSGRRRGDVNPPDLVERTAMDELTWPVETVEIR